MDFPLLAKVVKYARRAVGPKVEIELFTNGTLMTVNKIDFLLSQGIKIIVSIDGDKKTTDINRHFRAASSHSVFDVIMANLRKLGSKRVGKMYAGVTFNSKTVEHMDTNIKFLAGLGFKEVLVDIDILEIWKPSKLKLLERVLLKVKSICAKMAGQSFQNYGRSPVGLDFLFSREEKDAILRLPSFRELSLGPDGSFYPTGLISAQDSARSLYKLGNLKDGIDLKKIKIVLKEVKDYFSMAYFKGYAACPVNLYFYSRIIGNDPVKLLSSGESLYLSSSSVHQVVDSDSIAALLESDRDFGDFFHKPKNECSEPIKCMRVEMTDRGKFLKLWQAREAVDNMLYSQGNEKELILSGCFGSATFENVKGICVYSLLKAKYLKKRIRIIIEAVKNEWPDFQEADFMAEHDIFLRLCRNLPRSGRLTELLQKLRPEKIQIEIQAIGSMWPIKISKTAMTGFFHFIIMSRKRICPRVWENFKKMVFSRFINKERPIFFMNFLSLLQNSDKSKMAIKCPLSRRLKMNGNGFLSFEGEKSNIGETMSVFERELKICVRKGYSSRCAHCSFKNTAENIMQSNLDKKFKELIGKLLISGIGRRYIKQCYRESERHSSFHCLESANNHTKVSL